MNRLLRISLLALAVSTRWLGAQESSTLREDFNAPALNGFLWGPDSTNGGTASQTNGFLELTAQSGTPASLGSIRSNFYLMGDFDTLIEFELIKFDQYWSSAILSIGSVDKVHQMTIYVSVSADNNKHYESFYVINGSTQTPPNYYTPATGDSSLNGLTNGKLRIARTGKSITSYYWTGTEWKGLIAADLFDGPVGVMIGSGNGGSVGYQSSVTTHWDNFQATAGSIAKFVPINDILQCQDQSATISALQGQIQDLLAQINALNAQISQLQGQVTDLSLALQTLNAAILDGVTNLENDFRAEFDDPTFTIPGSTPLEKLNALENAVLGLNRGSKLLIYKALGGN